ncbi:MAG: AzlC family ABC transporter permease [Tepidiformaceae bacterium]
MRRDQPLARPEGFREGVRASIPLCIAVGAFGISFGVLARANGFGVLAPIVMSLTTFTGASQFATVSILGDGGGLGAAVVAALLLASRYLPIGLTVAPALSGRFHERFVASQLVIDESWAVANRGDGTFHRSTLVGAGLALYLSWFLGTVAGVLGGDFLGDPKDLGLDAAFPALFLVLLVSQLKTRQAVAAAVAGGLIALALTPFTKAGVPIIAASAACLAGWWRR